MDFIIELILFTGGGIAMGIIMLPYYMQSWQEGYDTAKSHYNNWEIGFDAGFAAGIETTLQAIANGEFIEIDERGDTNEIHNQW